jgi:LPS-assembly protein
MVPITTRSRISRCMLWRGAITIMAIALAVGSVDLRPASAQKRGLVQFPARPKPPVQPGAGLFSGPPKAGTNEQMLVRAGEVNYDYTNERVSAVGNVQIYYKGSTLEADQVIYDQKTKRLHAEGHIRLQEPDGKITHAEIIDLSDDFRDGFVDSLRLELPEQTRLAANRADRSSGNVTVLQSGVYTACEACKDDPRKPPKWQVKAARIIHDQGEKMIYFEDARLEFFGVPLAWLPYFSMPDPSEKRKSGFLVPSFGTGTNYGFAFTTPYYFALAPSYDATVTPMITTRQGPLLKGEFRQRLLNGSYQVRASGIFQLDQKAFADSGDIPGDREFRGHVDSAGQFRLTDKWVWGWDGTLITDKSYFQDYGLYKVQQQSNLLISTPDYVVSQAYLQGRGERSFFDMRAMYFYGFSTLDDQKRIPVIHPVIDHDYTVKQPVFGGELAFRSNLTSLSRESAFFDAITQSSGGICATPTADPALAKQMTDNCLLRGFPGVYSRFSDEASWRRTIVDSYGQMFTPFVSVRGDFADVQVQSDPGVSNYMRTGQSDVARFMPAVGLEYRYPFVNVQSWGTQIIEPIAQLIARPNETGINSLPNEDSQSLIFDATNLFRINKYAGWDRVEGGGRLNAGVSYTAQFNRGGYVNAVFGQSYHLFGQNSFAVGGPTNTGLDSGLDTDVSDYVGRLAYQPNSTFTFSSQFRFDQRDFSLQRTELQATANFERWSTSVLYGNYAAQPALGFLETREGVQGSVKLKVLPNWQIFGGAMYDLQGQVISAASFGVGYVDDCIILAVNYAKQYAYNSNSTYNDAVMFQLSLRTLGGNVISQGLSPAGSSVGVGAPGFATALPTAVH